MVAAHPHLFRFCEKYIIGQNISSSQGVLNFIVSVPPWDDPEFLLVESNSFLSFFLGVNNPPQKNWIPFDPVPAPSLVLFIDAGTKHHSPPQTAARLIPLSRLIFICTEKRACRDQDKGKDKSKSRRGGEESRKEGEKEVWEAFGRWRRQDVSVCSYCITGGTRMLSRCIEWSVSDLKVSWFKDFRWTGSPKCPSRVRCLDFIMNEFEKMEWLPSVFSTEFSDLVSALVFISSYIHLFVRLSCHSENHSFLCDGEWNEILGNKGNIGCWW